MVICYFGDSLTLGCGDPSGLGWPGRINDKLAEREPNLTGYNLGVRQNTTVKLSDRWVREAELRFLDGQDTKLVFSFGVADVMNGLPVRHTMAAGETILNQAKTFGEVLLVGPPPVINKQKAEAIADLSARFAELCETLDVPFVPIFTDLQTSDQYMKALEDGDSVHPTAMGYEALAEHILQSKTARNYFGL